MLVICKKGLFKCKLNDEQYVEQSLYIINN